ncbi:MAG TPA: monofunctional biosynthetic peptidoglycan transglycosylase [Rhizobiaceae bacterium]|nr:monofunctional biosynthetic peptidoglycan transglycosylase [Rhizobiaceae bacterium]
MTVGVRLRGRGKYRARGKTTRWLIRITAFLVVLALVPLALTFVYAIPSVHPISTPMLRDLVFSRPYKREWVSLDQISPNLIRSVIMSEDGQFCRHDGIDWGQMRKIVDGTLAGEDTRGASTITMQTVKNLFLWGGRSYLRKALEAPLALYFDAVLSKRRILEIYLNIARWGPGIYGAQAAAEYHFKRPASTLSKRQGALLAVTLPNPYLRHPERPTPGLRRLATLIERRTARYASSHVTCLD